MNDKSATKVIGMNSRGNLVDIVLPNGFVEVRELSGWTVQQRFAAYGVHDAAWNADDRLWLATADGVREVGVIGQATGRTAPDPSTPSAIAVSPQGELVVCDDSLRQQIRFCAISGPDVRLMSTFG